MASIFSRDPAVIKEAGSYRGGAQLLLAFQVIAVLSSAFLGFGHTRAPMVNPWASESDACGLLCCGFLRMGSMGIYWGMVGGNVPGAWLALDIAVGPWRKGYGAGVAGREATGGGE